MSKNQTKATSSKRILKVKQRKQPSELEVQKARYQKLWEEEEATRLRNGYALEASRIEHFKSRGLPVYAPVTNVDTIQEAIAKLPKHYHPVPVFNKDAATGYPFSQSVLFEQDPLFGQPYSGLDIMDLASPTFAVNAFPREMFPDRPSSLRTQVAQDAMRFMSRYYYEVCPQYSGPIGHLVNYTVGGGMDYRVVSDDEVLAQELNDWLQGLCGDTFWKLVLEATLNLFRDGDQFTRIWPTNGDYPELTSFDSSWIRGPHNEMTGPWSFGLLTSWPKRH